MNINITLLSLVFIMFHAGMAKGETFPYPRPDSLEKSELFEVIVNDKPVWTERYVSDMEMDKLPDWFSAPYVREPQEVHIAGFACNDQQSVQVKVNGDVGQVIIRPLSKGIKAEIEGNLVRFVTEGPEYLTVEIDSLPPLFLFADPLEKESFSRSDPGVIYFEPGIHRPGYIEPKDNQTVYIAPGAVVYGGIRANDVSNIRVTGRGILDGDFKFGRMVTIEGCENVSFDGITIRNGKGWTNTIINCRDVIYKNIKVISFGPGGDGINPLGTQRMKISECFLRCTDDCIAIKSPRFDFIVKDILIENNTMIGFAYSDGVTIGFETNGRFISDVMVRNCDILMARGGSRVEGHSGFSIICDGPAEIHNIFYDNIRVEKTENKLFELHITDGSKYGVEPPGNINNIRLRNISWKQEGPIALQGFDQDHMVKNVFFDNCKVNGELLYSTSQEYFRIGEFVEGIYFE